jgi:hypothetical protein
MIEELFSSQEEWEIFLCFTASRLALGPTLSLFSRCQWLFLWGKVAAAWG